MFGKEERLLPSNGECTPQLVAPAKECGVFRCVCGGKHRSGKQEDDGEDEPNRITLAFDSVRTKRQPLYNVEVIQSGTLQYVHVKQITSTAKHYIEYLHPVFSL